MLATSAGYTMSLDSQHLISTGLPVRSYSIPIRLQQIIQDDYSNSTHRHTEIRFPASQPKNVAFKPRLFI
jgi:hypothetical protein